MIDDETRAAVLAEYFKERAKKAGQIGGKSRSKKKRAAARDNLEKNRYRGGRKPGAKNKPKPPT